MNRRIGLIVLSAAISTSVAKTPQQLMTELTDILQVPSGKKAVCVWSQKESATSWPIYYVTSNEGVIKKLSSTVAMNAWSPQVTADGSRVIYYDRNSGKARVITMAGVVKDIANTQMVEDYWRNPADNSDNAILRNGSVSRVNIDTKATTALPGSPGDDGVRVSADCKYYASANGGGWGITNISTGQVTKFCSGGCGPNIAPDNTYRISVQISAHKAVNICTAPGGSGTAYSNYDITAGILSTVKTTVNCVAADAQYADTRWPLPNTLTFAMYNLVGNPYIFRISDKKWMFINDALGCVSGEMGSSPLDVAIVPISPTGVRDPNAGSPIIARRGAAEGCSEWYSLDGRQILQSTRKVENGIRIQRIPGTGARLHVSFGR